MPMFLLALAELSAADWFAVGGGVLTFLSLVAGAAWWCSAIYRDVHSMTKSLAKIVEKVDDHEKRLLRANL